MRRADRKKSGERSGVHILNESFHVFRRKVIFQLVRKKKKEMRNKMIKEKIKRKPTTSYWKSKRSVRRHIFHLPHPGSCAVQEDTLAPKEDDEAGNGDFEAKQFESQLG